MRSRSNLLVLLGIAFFVVGGIIVFLLTGDDDDGGSAGPSGTVTAIVSNTDIAAGALADDLIADGRLSEKKVPASELPAGAIQSVNQLEGATFVQGFAKDQPITAIGVQLQQRRFEVPEGFDAIAVQLDFVGAGAGYVNAGDRLNLYTAFSTEYSVGNPETLLPRAELSVSNVLVLDVSQTVPARRGTPNAEGTVRAGGESITYLLAVRPEDAEKLVYSTEFQVLYATLADEAVVAQPTPGQDGESIIASDSNVAN